MSIWEMIGRVSTDDAPISVSETMCSSKEGE